MPLFTSRKKSVTFRLSSEEYEALRNYCIASKVRSVSELARESILMQVYGDRSQRSLISGDLVALGSALVDIDLALKNLSGRISRVLGPAQKYVPWSKAIRNSEEKST
jgi:hypothetical protein